MKLDCHCSTSNYTEITEMTEMALPKASSRNKPVNGFKLSVATLSFRTIGTLEPGVIVGLAELLPAAVFTKVNNYCLPSSPPQDRRYYRLPTANLCTAERAQVAPLPISQIACQPFRRKI